MKNLFYFLLLNILIAHASYGQNIGFNKDGSLPNSKAMLDIASTNSGLLIPRMTTAQRDSISTPPNGLQVYNLTTNTLDIFRNSQWEGSFICQPNVKCGAGFYSRRLANSRFRSNNIRCFENLHRFRIYRHFTKLHQFEWC